MSSRWEEGGGGRRGPGDLEADAAGGAGDDDGDAVERGQLERVGEVAGGDPLEEELPHHAHPPAAPLQPPQRLLPSLLHLHLLLPLAAADLGLRRGGGVGSSFPAAARRFAATVAQFPGHIDGRQTRSGSFVRACGASAAAGARRWRSVLCSSGLLVSAAFCPFLSG